MAICSSSILQLWDITPFDGDYHVVRNRGGGCLDADNRGGRSTFVAHVIPCTNLTITNPYQRWALAGTGNGVIYPEGFAPTPGHFNALGLDNSRVNADGFGFRVNIWPLDGNDAQRFSLEPRRDPL